LKDLSAILERQFEKDGPKKTICDFAFYALLKLLCFID